MDRNICSDGTPTNTTKTDKCFVAWVTREDFGGTDNEWSNGQHNNGPITAMNYLYSRGITDEIINYLEKI